MLAFYERKIDRVQITLQENMTFPQHMQKELEFLVCLGGEIQVTCQEQGRILRPLDVMIALPGVLHAYQTVKSSTSMMGIVAPALLPLFQPYFNKTLVLPFFDGHSLGETHQSLTQQCTKENLPAGAILGYTHFLLSAAFSLAIFSEKPQARDVPLLPRIIEYLSLHFRDSLTLPHLSGVFGLNCAYLSRLFSASVGCTLTDYLHQLRIQHAKQLLSTTNLSVTEIAFESGFSTQRSFHRVFSALENCTPTDYRKQKKQG